MRWPWTKLIEGLTSELESLRRALDAIETAPAPEADTTLVDEQLRALTTEVREVNEVIASHAESIDALASAQKDLVVAVGEGIERTERYERRIRATVKRAKKELAEQGLQHSGLDAEDVELQLLDGAGSEERGLLPMSEDVGQPEQETSSIKGVPAETLRRFRGFA